MQYVNSFKLILNETMSGHVFVIGKKSLKFAS